MSQPIVLKFGGSSLCDAAHFQKAKEIIKSDPARRFIVVSAPGKRFAGDEKVTDMLYACYEAAKERADITPLYEKIADRYNGIVRDLGIDLDLSGELNYIKNAILHHSGRDFAASRGEYLSAIILAKLLSFNFVDAEEAVFFREDGALDPDATESALASRLSSLENAVIPGFYGVMPNGTIKTFSRGGSDITGSLVAEAVGASLYENWTDVSGCLMADPRVVEDPLPIKTVTYKELRELAYMGATVLHEDAIFPVRRSGIPINIRNTNAPEEEGTLIVARAEGYDTRHAITGIAGKKGLSVVNIEKEMMNGEIGFGRKVLDVLEENNISFEHLPSGIDTMSVILSTAQLGDERKREKIKTGITRAVHPDSVTVEDGLALLAVVGRGMVKVKGTAARVFSSLSKAGINIRMIDQGSSELNIIIGLEEADLDRAISTIYHEFVKE